MKIDQIRQDIPDLGNKLFLNSAGASLVPSSVNKAIRDYLQKEEQLGGYLAEERLATDIAGFYRQAATLLHCHERNIAFTSSATDGYIKALSSIDWHAGDLIVTTDDDYSSNHLQFISLKDRRGVDVERISTLDNGDLDLEDFKRLIDDRRPKLVAVSHVPTNSGLVQDVKSVGALCKEYDVLFLLDACQSFGQFDLDLQDIHCDFMTTASRKFMRGPRGTGLLYVSDRLLGGGHAPILLDNSGAEWTGVNSYELEKTAKRFETWERSNALIMGMQEAMRYANDIGMSWIGSRNEELVARLRSNLQSIPGVSLYDRGSRTCNILTFRKSGRDLQEMHDHLIENEVYFSLSLRKSGVIDFDQKGIDGAVRFSPHYFNTLEEMDRAAEIVMRM